jgi:hypothetical protein
MKASIPSRRQTAPENHAARMIATVKAVMNIVTQHPAFATVLFVIAMRISD